MGIKSEATLSGAQLSLARTWVFKDGEALFLFHVSCWRVFVLFCGWRLFSCCCYCWYFFFVPFVPRRAGGCFWPWRQYFFFSFCPPYLPISFGWIISVGQSKNKYRARIGRGSRVETAPPAINGGSLKRERRCSQCYYSSGATFCPYFCRVIFSFRHKWRRAAFAREDARSAQGNTCSGKA